ncbi:hypothetical protein, partial [Phascolarctobacterium succinatutens]|uniref:hypothetical protein n=1 Tax=Phascolarctobacterium succinatutens TaxID=626940 RepID=UPI0023F9D9F3
CFGSSFSGFCSLGPDSVLYIFFFHIRHLLLAYVPAKARQRNEDSYTLLSSYYNTFYTIRMHKMYKK